MLFTPDDKFSTNAAAPTVTDANMVTVERMEEQLTVGKHLVTTGQVTLRKTVELAEEHITLQRLETSYEVERIAVNQVFEQAPPAVRELSDGTIVYAVVREVPVVVTRYEVIEELHVRPRHTARDEEYVMPVRRERIDIERSPIAATPAATDLPTR